MSASLIFFAITDALGIAVAVLTLTRPLFFVLNFVAGAHYRLKASCGALLLRSFVGVGIIIAWLLS